MSDFAASVEQLHTQVRHWEQPRWSGPAPIGRTGTRADLMYALVQLLADLGADAEQRPHRAVPREHDMILPDQLRVMADDLLAAGALPSVLASATAAVEDLRFTL
ncbi:hypothetical protein ACWKSP_11155 [Micromonosporaceae bacterium Da 78-11]